MQAFRNFHRYFDLGLSHKEAVPLDSRDRSNGRNPGYLLYIRDYISQLYGDCNTPS